MFDNGCKRSRHSWIKLHTIHRNIVGSLCPSFKHQKNLSFWTGTSLIILLQICNMKQMNCSAFWIALQFIFISLWNTSLNRQHTFLSNLRSFSVPYILVVLIFFGEKIYSTCLSLQISTWLIKQIIKWFHKNFISVWRKPYSSLKKTLNIQE